MASEPFRTSTQPWYAGERICGPDFFKANRIDAVYPDPGTPWRYPNAGCMAGRAQHVLQLIEDLLHGASPQVSRCEGCESHETATERSEIG